jgi:protein gp37
MSDLFQDAVPDEYIIAVADVMLRAPWHTFQVLTKRAKRMEALLNSRLGGAAAASHIWWGVSVEDKRYGVPRIADLRRTPARTRFLSIEPLLEDLGKLDLSGINWVIVGGESGGAARPMKKEWVEAVRQACSVANTPFFFKQWGGVQKSKHGRALNGRTYDEIPARSTRHIPSRAERLTLVRSLASLTDGWPESPLVQLKAHRVVA